MKFIFEVYDSNQEILVKEYLMNKKLSKYFNRETAAAIVCFGKFKNQIIVPDNIPFYYSLGSFEYEDYGLEDISNFSIDKNSVFSNESFINDALPRISPLNQFKVLQNMPLSFISIVYKLTGDNAVVYDSALSLLLQALYSNPENEMLIGASKIYMDGKVEVGFALVGKNEINDLLKNRYKEAIDLFKHL